MVTYPGLILQHSIPRLAASAAPICRGRAGWRGCWIWGNGRSQPPDGPAQAGRQHQLAIFLSLPLGEGRGEGASGIFTGREMRPVPERVAQFPEPFESGFFDCGFVEGHLLMLQ